MVRSKKDEALQFHSSFRPGKIGIQVTKPMENRDQLSLAYTPGVADVCLEIAKNPDDVYKYTAKGNMVAVITNGTAVLGLGDIGPAASKPVMEGKAALFKKFADIDAIDIEISEKDPEKFVEIVKSMEYTWGGINLEDIKSPFCFEIEKKLIDSLSIPVFHDDQHGTAIVVAASLLNAADISGKSIKNMKVVINGPGAAGIACGNLLKTLGIEELLFCDRIGVLRTGRDKPIRDWQRFLAVNTQDRTLSDALKGADVFIGLSSAGALNGEMISKMNKDPIIFAMANPTPEIFPNEALEFRPDVIIATGRSDFPNQINNVMAFPYIFRGALDARAKKITDDMKLAAVRALADIVRQPSEYGVYGKQYIIPSPFDPRLLEQISKAVKKASIAYQDV